MKLRVLAVIVATLCISMTELRAQFTWIGAGPDNNLTTPSNWLGGVAPTGSGTEDLTFGDSPRLFVTLPTTFAVNDVTHTASGTGYFLGGNGDTLTVNGNVASTAGSGGFFVFAESTLNLSTGSHVFTVDGAYLYIFGALAGDGSLTKTGNGGLTVSSGDGVSTYTGAIDLQSGDLVAAGDGSLGSGTLTMNGGRLYTNGYDDDRVVTLNNSLRFTSNTAYFGNPDSPDAIRLLFTGDASTIPDVTSVDISVLANTELTILGNIGESALGTSYTISGPGTVIFGGDGTYTGDTTVNDGVLIFRGSPSGFGEFRVTGHAYFGRESTFNYQVDFINLFNKTDTTGIIGFDSPNINSPQTFSGPLDLTGFDSQVRIGTATAAIFSGTFLPQGDTYKFGGRGIFTVTTDLGDFVDGANLEVSDGLLLYLTGSNNYTGYTLAYGGGAVIFNSLGSLPLTGDLESDPGGYVGHTEVLGLTASQFISYFEPDSTFGVVGFDSAVAGVSRIVNDPVDLSGLDSGVFLGSATSATFNGLITPNGQIYRFTGFRQGAVIVNSILSDIDLVTPRAVVIGLDSDNVFQLLAPGSYYNPSVTLNGHNTYTGGTLIQSGQLIIGANDALGTGTLTIGSFNPVPAGLSAGVAGINLPNTIDFGETSNDIFNLNGDIDFTLSGNLLGGSDDNRIFKGGNSTITLNGDNSNLYTGFIVRDGALIFASDTGAGLGMIELINSGASGGLVRFTSGAPSMGTLRGEGQTTVDITTGVLRIHESTNETFDGIIQGSGGIAKEGDATLSLTNTLTYTGPTQVGAGTLEVHGSITHAGSDVTVGYIPEEGAFLNIVSGGQITSANGIISTDSLGFGSVSVQGANSKWIIGNALTVGVHGSGELSISGGGLVSSASGTLGQNGANGTVALSGVGSVWNITGGLNVGTDSAVGFFQIYDDAHLNIGSGAGTINLAVDAGSIGTFVVGLSEDAPHGGVVNAANIVGGAGVAEFQFDTGTSSTAPYYLTKDGTSGGAAVVLSGSLSVLNRGGFNVLTGNNTYSGGTFLQGGILVAGSNNALGTGLIHFQGGALSVASGVTLSTPLDFTGGGTLSGNGTFVGPITVGNGVDLAPGNSVGLLSFTGGLTWGQGGTYDVEVQFASGGRGVGYDSIDVTGGLTFTATLGSPFTINLISLDAGGAAGLVSDFNSSNGYAWLVAHTDGISGFDPANITLNTGSFANTLGTGAFHVFASGNDIYVNFSPVPEPSTYALLGIGLGTILLPWLRRRRSA